MPTILLTRSECERSLVPAVCARCGIPADDAIRLALITPALHGLIATLLVLCPPLFLLLVWQLRHRPRLRMPMCRPDGDDWRWRDKLTSWTYVAVVLGTYLAVPVVVAATGELWGWEVVVPGGFVTYYLVWNYWALAAAILWTRTVRASKLVREGLRFSGVHAAFVAAVWEDRARDPDPARRIGFGDVRDDYDDGPG
jgi:hypothetical protein